MGNFFKLLDYTAQEEEFMKDHFSSSCFKRTSPDTQNELIEIITSALNEQIQREMKEACFVSVQADETLDVSCKSQLSIIFWYCIADRAGERFIGFLYVSTGKTAKCLSEIILNVLKEWDINSKLVSQAYDGAVVMAAKKWRVQGAD